jgi:hypothetical protein
MSKRKAKLEEIANSGLMIELDIPAHGVLAIASFLANLKAELPSNALTTNLDVLLSQFIASLEFNFPGTHSILFPEVELVRSKYEEL